MKDKVIIITGGSKGIGRETAKKLAVNNTVIITGRREEELKKTSEVINREYGSCMYIQGDVTSVEDCEKVINTVLEKYNRIDVLINNAGMSMRGLFQDTTLELFHKIIDINFLGAVNMTKLALPSITKNKGSILFVSSLSGLKGIPGIAPYGTAKMALTGFTESLRAEVYHLGVHIGIVYVGFTENDSDKTVYTSTGERMPINRAKNNDTQEDVANSIIKCIQKRKAMMYLTFTGKLSKFFFQFFPRLSSYLLRKFTMNSEMYNV